MEKRPRGRPRRYPEEVSGGSGRGYEGLPGVSIRLHPDLRRLVSDMGGAHYVRELIRADLRQRGMLPDGL